MDASIVGVLGTVLGVLVAGPLTYYFSRVLVEKTHANALVLLSRQEATRAFLVLEATFIPTKLIFRKPKRTGDDFCRIPTLYESQTIAMLAFVEHLTGKSRENFEEKWSKYQEWHQEYEELEASSPYNLGLDNMICRMKNGEFQQMVTDVLEAAKQY